MKLLLVIGFSLALFASCSASEQDAASVPGATTTSPLLSLIEVPSIVGQPSDYAAGYLSVIGLTLVIAGGGDGNSVVIGQIPAAGSQVAAGTSVRAEVAVPATTTMPTSTTIPTTTLPPTTSPPPTTSTTTTSTTTTVAAVVDPGDSKNCSDFWTYAEAKAWFDTYFASFGDVAGLDSDGDGEPCKSLPGGPTPATSTSTTVVPTTTTAEPIDEVAVLTTPYPWGFSWATFVLQQVLGITPDGWYGFGTRAAHLAENQAWGLSLDGIPPPPTTTSTTSPTTLPPTTLPPTTLPPTTTTRPPWPGVLSLSATAPSCASVTINWELGTTSGLQSFILASKAPDGGWITHSTHLPDARAFTIGDLVSGLHSFQVMANYTDGNATISNIREAAVSDCPPPGSEDD